MIRVSIQVPELYRSKAEYVFRVFALRWGIPILFTRDEPDLIYGNPSSSAAAGATLCLPFDESAYQPQTVCALRRRDASSRWVVAGDDREWPDLVGATYRLLTHLDESQVLDENRDRRGIFVNAALPPERAIRISSSSGGPLSSRAGTSTVLTTTTCGSVYPTVAQRQAVRAGSYP